MIIKSLKYLTQSLILLRAVKYSVGNIFLGYEVDEEGIKVAPRIIGGSESSPGDFPWHARQIDANGEWAGCGGSLVTNEFVLTAAHCVFNDTDISQFQIGALCAPYEPDDNCGQTVETFGVIDVFVHPDYYYYTSEADYALIRLDGTSSITPVTMDRGEISLNYDGSKNLLVSGFGKLTNNYGTDDVPDNLNDVEVQFISNEDCNALYDGMANVTDSMICAAGEGKDACFGDSGGPLYDEENDAIVGIVSWGIGCAQAEFPGVYANIAAEWQWIEETICNNHEEPLPSFCLTQAPSTSTSHPTSNPSLAPTLVPSTASPTAAPIVPSTRPSSTASAAPSESNLPSSAPVIVQSSGPSVTLSDAPTPPPSVALSDAPSSPPVIDQSPVPSATLSDTPSSPPVLVQSQGPSATLSSSPSTLPTIDPSSALTTSPSSTPSSSPTVTFSDSPSIATVVAPVASQPLCENPKHSLVEVQITTDAYGNMDNSFYILIRKEGKFKKRVRIKQMESLSTMTLTRCLPRRKCFRAVVLDSYGDGICCNYGEGTYTVKWVGEEVVSKKQFRDGFRDSSPTFGDGC